MIANYHTHTWRCNHAKGQDVKDVENAGWKFWAFPTILPIFSRRDTVPGSGWASGS